MCTVHIDLCFYASFIQNLKYKLLKAVVKLHSRRKHIYIQCKTLKLNMTESESRPSRVSATVKTKLIKLKCQVLFTCLKMLIGGRCFCFSSLPSHLSLTVNSCDVTGCVSVSSGTSPSFTLTQRGGINECEMTRTL